METPLMLKIISVTIVTLQLQIASLVQIQPIVQFIFNFNRDFKNMYKV